MVKEFIDPVMAIDIPADWNLVPLGNCVTEKLSYGVNAPAIPYRPGFPRYIRITDITEDGQFDDGNPKSVITAEREKYTLKDGDIVLARTGASTGKSYLYRRSDGELVYAGFLIKASIDITHHNPRFIVGQLTTKRYWNWVATTSMRSGQPGINGKEYSSFLIPVAPKKEQEEIARTLSEFDIYIDDLAELIEKKRGIRDGALEDLMSGHTRLEGYDKAWSTYLFDDYFSLLPTNTYAREQLTDKGNVGDVHYGDVLIKYGVVLTDKDDIPRLKDSSDIKERSLLKRKDVLIADTAEDDTVGKVVQVGAVTIPLVGGLHTVACRPNYETADGFLGYYMNSTSYHDQLYPYITGIKVSSVAKKSFTETELYIPSDVKEQRAIADTLTAMDKEIGALENERDKMIQIREGAMDDLLTGRIRLKA